LRLIPPGQEIEIEIFALTGFQIAAVIWPDLPAILCLARLRSDPPQF